MKNEEYQKSTNSTAIYPKHIEEEYLMSGIAGEVGELVSKYAKRLRKGSNIDREYVDGIAGELGDILWFVSQLCNYHHLSLSNVMESNINKLKDRKQRGVIEGDGDKR